MADQIRYDLLAQDALRSVVRRVLADVARDGLPGEHHFYISFDTRAPGVRLPQFMRDKYPEEMTVVLQHQFWDLKVTDVGFEVGLSFSDTPEKLVIPFNAIRGFYDPSVNFELEFDVPLADEEEAESAEITAYPAQPEKAETPAPAAEGDEKKPGSVVSLDSFRKKQ